MVAQADARSDAIANRRQHALLHSSATVRTTTTLGQPAGQRWMTALDQRIRWNQALLDDPSRHDSAATFGHNRLQRLLAFRNAISPAPTASDTSQTSSPDRGAGVVQLADTSSINNILVSVYPIYAGDAVP